MRRDAANVFIERVSLPEGSLVSALAFTDHADAFRVRVERDRFPDVDAFARRFLSLSPPGWVRAAMRTRDAVVGTLFGLKTASGAGSAGLFREVDRTANEVLLGEDDRHLDFRVSLFYAGAGEADGVGGWGDACGEGGEGDAAHAVDAVDARYPDGMCGKGDLRERGDQGEFASITVSTVVRFKNALGRAYFFPVRPVHGIVVPAMMRRVLEASRARGAETPA